MVPVNLNWNNLDSRTQDAIRLAINMNDGKSFLTKYYETIYADKLNGNHLTTNALISTLQGANLAEKKESYNTLEKAVKLATILNGMDKNYIPNQTTRMNKTQKNNTKSKLTVMALYAGTRVSIQGFDICAMVKYVSKNKKLDSVALIATDADNTNFTLASGKEQTLEISVKASKKLGKGTLSLGASIIDTRGTDVLYSIGAGTNINVTDNPGKRMGKTLIIGYTLPIIDNIVSNINYRQYKNNISTTTTTYVSVKYKF